MPRFHLGDAQPTAIGGSHRILISSRRHGNRPIRTGTRNALVYLTWAQNNILKLQVDDSFTAVRIAPFCLLQSKQLVERESRDHPGPYLS